MKIRFAGRSALAGVIVLSLSFGIAPVAQAQTSAAAQEEAMTQDTALSDEEQEKISQELSEGFETLFTEVIYEQSPGKWSVDYEAAERENVSAEEAESLVEFMEAPLPDETQPSVSAQSLGTYAECVVWNFAPVPMSPQDAAAIGNLLKAKQWRAAAEKITQVAALNGATAALDYGISAIGGPVVWVAKLALYAGSCALSEQL